MLERVGILFAADVAGQLVNQVALLLGDGVFHPRKLRGFSLFR